MSVALAPGTQLGRYEILAPIATGGMARVWAARMKGSHGFAKIVALKTLLPGVSDDDQYESMFLDEAHIASKIRHGNVVEIHDLGEERGVLYLVMEYVDGEPLTTLRRVARPHGRVPLPLTLKIIADAAEGLHAAHQLSGPDGTKLGLVHRDVSPQNILISYEGLVKVTDFGIAKAVGRVSKTLEHTFKGKPAFMSPEQIEGAEVDCRADVFGLGLVMYQLLTDMHPFRGDTDIITVQNIIGQRPILRPSTHNPAIDPKLDQIVLHALERDRDRRFQSARELELAIEERLSRTRRPRSDELGVLMERLLGEQGRARRRALEKACAHLDEGAREGSGFVQIPVSPAPASQPSHTPDTQLAAVASVASADTRRVPTRSRRIVPLIAALGAVALLAIVAVLVVRSSPPRPNALRAVGPATLRAPMLAFAAESAAASATSDRASSGAPKEPARLAQKRATGRGATQASSTSAASSASAAPSAASPRRPYVPVPEPDF